MALVRRRLFTGSVSYVLRIRVLYLDHTEKEFPVPRQIAENKESFDMFLADQLHEARSEGDVDLVEIEERKESYILGYATSVTTTRFRYNDGNFKNPILVTPI